MLTKVFSWTDIAMPTIDYNSSNLDSRSQSKLDHGVEWPSH